MAKKSSVSGKKNKGPKGKKARAKAKLGKQWVNTSTRTNSKRSKQRQTVAFFQYGHEWVDPPKYLSNPCPRQRGELLSIAMTTRINTWWCILQSVEEYQQVNEAV
jgi:hypothetical protein